MPKFARCLATYERASGQQINQAKTTLFFSKSTIEDMQTLMIYIYIYARSYSYTTI